MPQPELITGLFSDEIHSQLDEAYESMKNGKCYTTEEAVEKRDGDQADYYYHQALRYAREANDTRYITMIEKLLEDIKRWRENVDRIKKQK